MCGPTQNSNVQTIEAASQTIAFCRLSIILACRFDATRHYERNLSELIDALSKRYATKVTPFVLVRSVNSRSRRLIPK